MLPTTKTIELAEKLGFLKEKRSDWEKSRASLNDVQDWLRDSYDIHCSVAPWKESDPIVTMYEGNVIDAYEKEVDVVFISSYFSNYYECLEECIIHALKLLKKYIYGKEK